MKVRAIPPAPRAQVHPSDRPHTVEQPEVRESGFRFRAARTLLEANQSDSSAATVSIPRDRAGDALTDWLTAQAPETVLDPANAEAALESLGASGTAIELNGEVGHCTALPLAYDAGILKLVLDGLVSPGRCQLKYLFHGVGLSIFGRLTSAGATKGPQRDTFPLAATFEVESVELPDRRTAARVPCEGTLAFFVRTSDEQRTLTARVLDIAPSGLGVEGDGLPPLGSEIFGILRLGTRELCLMGEVVRRTSQVGPHKYAERAGLKIDMDSCRRTDCADGGLTSEIYRDAYLEARFPRLRRRETLPLQDLEALFRDSGYLALRDGEGLSQEWHQFRHVRSADLAFVDSTQRPIGHVSVTQGYRKTWLLHQLATLKDQPETGPCRQELYGLLSCGPTLLGGDDAMAIAYFNQERYWHRRFFGEFLKWTSDETLAAFAAWDRLEPGAEKLTYRLPDGYELRPLRSEEGAEAAALIRFSLPALLSNCLDITPQSLSFASTHIMSDRERHSFGLFKDGHMTAIALCETGPEGSSVFNIFNMAQVLVRSDRHRPSSEAQLGLISEVLAFYSQRGVDSPLLVSGPDHLADDVLCVVPRAEQMGCVGMSNAGLRRWETYCQIQMGRLYADQPQSESESAAE